MQVVTQRLMKLATKGTPVHLPAEVIIRRRKRVRNSSGPSTDTWEMVRARGHLDEVEQLKSSAAPPSSESYLLPAWLASIESCPSVIQIPVYHKSARANLICCPSLPQLHSHRCRLPLQSQRRLKRFYSREKLRINKDIDAQNSN